jgi:hypothetical protein
VASSAATVSPIQIECSLHLAVPQAPADVLHSIGEAGAFLAVFVCDVRPAFDCLGDMLDAHRQVEPYVDGPLLARCFAVL